MATIYFIAKPNDNHAKCQTLANEFAASKNILAGRYSSLLWVFKIQTSFSGFPQRFQGNTFLAPKMPTGKVEKIQ